MRRFAVGLGSNQGDRLDHLRTGLSRLGSVASVEAVSSVYETEPMGGPEQAPFLNAIVVIETDLEPAELLSRLHEIEAMAGRKRSERWGPRTLDLDIVASDGPRVVTDDLKVPHERSAEREFVLRPLAEVWPDADVGGISAEGALRHVSDQGVDRLGTNWEEDTVPWIGWVLVSVQMVWFIAIALAFAADGGLPGDSVEVTHVAGGLMAFVGIVLAFVASRRLGPGLRAAPEPVRGADLVETGPYAHARHPIYGGVFLFLTGTSLFLDSILGFALSIGLGVFFTVKSSYEERRLRMRYAGYREYRHRVRNRLIPFVF